MAISKIENNSLASGVPSTANLPAGTVLQVVNATYGTNTQTTSGSYVDTGLSASITPSSATSKILVFADVQAASNTGTNGFLSLRVVRGSTAIVGMSNAAFYLSGNMRASVSTSYLDSPATTGAITYKVQMRSPAGGSVGISIDGSDDTSTITLMEIAA